MPLGGLCVRRGLPRRLVQGAISSGRPGAPTDAGVDPVLPSVSAAVMRAMLAEPSQAVTTLGLAALARAHRLWPTHDDILDASCQPWNALLDGAGGIRSLCGGSPRPADRRRSTPPLATRSGRALPGSRVASRSRPSTPASAVARCQRHTTGQSTPARRATSATGSQTI